MQPSVERAHGTHPDVATADDQQALAPEARRQRAKRVVD